MGNVGDLDGKTKKLIEERFGPVSANPDNLENNKEAGGGAQGTQGLSKNCTMTRMTEPDCAVMCNLINTHTHTHTLVEWALASIIIAGNGAAAARLPTPEQIVHNPIVRENKTYLGHDALRQVHLPIREGDLGLTSSNSIKGAIYIGCHALVLGRIDTVSTRGNLPSLLERLPELPMASVLLEELKIVASEDKRS